MYSELEHFYVFGTCNKGLQSVLYYGQTQKLLALTIF